MWREKLIHHRQTMDGDNDETEHIVSLGEFKTSKSYKEKKLKEIMAAVCAMLNSKGGRVTIHIDTDSSNPVKSIPSSQMSRMIRILEQYMISVFGVHSATSKIHFKDVRKDLLIFLEKADFLITINYNLYFPSQTQIVQLSAMESEEMIRDNIINRKIIPEPVQVCRQHEIFRHRNKCSLEENKVVAFKNLKANPSKRTTLADRMISKGNKFACYVSAFANHRGGHIYYGIADDGVVEGEFIPNEKEREEITKKVGKAVKKMIWPEHIGQPKRGEHWEIFFDPVVDENSNPVPSTFVIVIYIAPCLGGVFTEEPESYEMVDRIVSKVSFATWKKRISRPVWLWCKDEIPSVVPRITWSSDVVREAFTVGYEKLRILINNGDWDAFSKECQSLQKQSQLQAEKSFVVLSKKITACYAQGNFSEGSALLEQFKTQLSQVQDSPIYEVIGLNLEAALTRANGDFEGLTELLTEALSKAEMIEPGLVTATVYIFAGSVADLINLKQPTIKFSPHVLSIRALEHLQRVKDFPSVVADKKQRVYITLATSYLGCNLNGYFIQSTIDTSDLDKAKASIMTVHESTCDGNPLSKYREVQLKLVQSIYSYRHSQISPEKRVVLLRSAFESAKEAEHLSKKYKFTEMLEWSKRNEALCTEELVRAKFASINPKKD